MNLLASLKLTVGLVLAVLLFFGGRSCASQRLQDQLAEQARVMDAKNRALRAAARSFRAFAATFRSIDAHTQAQLAEGRRRAALDREAAARAGAAQADAEARVRQLEQDLAAARRRSGCRQVFEADLEASCGVILR